MNSPTSEAVIYHNPKCSTSRKVLDALRERGVEPAVVEYLKTGWTAEQLRQLFADAGLTAREALRTRLPAGVVAPASDANDDEIIDAMVAQPVLVERPFVVTSRGTRLSRPVERVLEIL